MRVAVMLSLALALAACAPPIVITDRYGNSYGSWYNPGEKFSYQLDKCDREIAESSIPLRLRKLHMRCCMWRNGVPISDPGACSATG